MSFAFPDFLDDLKGSFVNDGLVSASDKM